MSPRRRSAAKGVKKGSGRKSAKADVGGELHKLDDKVYRYLGEESPSAAIVINLDGTVSELNKSMLATTGYSREDYLGKSALDFVVPEQRQRIAEVLGLAGRGEWTPEVEVDIFARDGSIRTMLFSPGHAFIYRGETPTAILITGMDITERKLTARRLIRAARMEALVGLAGGIAHDFNNLLTVILSYARLVLKDRSLSASSREMLEEVVGAAERAEGLTQKLHLFSREKSPEVDLVDINDIMRGMEASLAKRMGEGVSLRLELTPGLPALRLSADLIANAVENIAANASEAMPRGGTVTIRTSAFEGRPPGIAEQGRFLSLAVSDEGEGIDEGIRDRLFEPFFTTRRDRNARGLGLSIVYGAVRQCSGGISVESVPGKGTTVTIYLPVQG